jgi:hypothetical protein
VFVAIVGCGMRVMIKSFCWPDAISTLVTDCTYPTFSAEITCHPGVISILLKGVSPLYNPSM